MILYTSNTCKYCPEIKSLLKKLKLEYEERNVSEPEWRKLLVDGLGLTKVPVLVNKNKVYIGKDEIMPYLHLSNREN